VEVESTKANAESLHCCLTYCESCCKRRSIIGAAFKRCQFGRCKQTLAQVWAAFKKFAKAININGVDTNAQHFY
jgi:hypothetical protein